MTTHFNVSLPSEHHAAWKAQAAADDCALNDWILQCVLANLPASVAADLTPHAARKIKPRPAAQRSDSNATFRIDVRCPDDWPPAIAAAAAAGGMNRSQWIRWACNANLPTAVQRSLVDERAPGRPPAE